MLLNQNQKIYYTLRTAVVMCFIGHGAFGIIGKPIWCSYFAVFGIDKVLAYQMMPYLGAFDIMMGILMLIYPMRAIALWLVVWGTMTALLRPLSGEPFAEFVERAGNYGAPLVLLIVTGFKLRNKKDLFARICPKDCADGNSRQSVTICLRVIVFLILAGHGWLNIIGKNGLISQYNSLGFSNPAGVALSVGIFEIVTAFTLLIRPSRPLILILFIWKMSSELFYPHYEFFEWVERGGSYGSLLALWFALKSSSTLNIQKKIFSTSGKSALVSFFF